MSQTPELPSWLDVQSSLTAGGVGIDAAELHGLMIGFLAAGGDLPNADWPAHLHVDIDPADLADDDTLARLRSTSEQALCDPQLGFAPLLPGDETALVDRADALFSWCGGFLAGFALVPQRPGLTEDAQEAFDDLAQIAAFVRDDEEQDEQALEEIIEFTRVAVLLIHGDVLGSRQGTQRLH